MKKILQIISNLQGLVLKNIFWSSANFAINIISGILIGALVARHLGAEGLGKLSYGMSFMNIIMAICGLGLHGIIVRELVKNPDKKNALIGTSFLFQLLASILLYGLLYIFIKFFNHGEIIKNGTIILILCISLAFDSVSVVNCFLESKHLNNITAIASIAYLLIFSVIRIILVQFGKDLMWFVFAQAFCKIVLDFIILGIAFKYNCSPFKWCLNLKLGLDLLKDSWPMITTGLVFIMLSSSDQIMITHFDGDAETGEYSTAFRIIHAQFFLATLLIGLIWPVLIRKHKVGQEVFLDSYKAISQFFALIGYAIFIISIIISGKLIITLYGVEYKDSILIYQLLSIRIILYYANVVHGQTLVIYNEMKWFMFISISRVILNIILNYLFIPKWGNVGAVYATLTSDVFFMFIDLLNPKIRKLRLIFFQALLNPFSKLKQAYWLIREINTTETQK